TNPTHPAHSRLILFLRLALDACRELWQAQMDTSDSCTCPKGERAYQTCAYCTQQEVAKDAHGMEFSLDLVTGTLEVQAHDLPEPMDRLEDLLKRWHALGDGGDVAALVLARMEADPEIRAGEEALAVCLAHAAEETDAPFLVGATS